MSMGLGGLAWLGLNRCAVGRGGWCGLVAMGKWWVWRAVGWGRWVLWVGWRVAVLVSGFVGWWFLVELDSADGLALFSSSRA